ncbi:two-component system response regulator [Aliikangiella coralliicola]|uniref:Diguanylate cyclase n=1 Tax=Aliikangiella coralliicola TaxID=2592383 RepID=A0A545UA43_9GAMM|nr:GGDEF domain-containing response regulator [Aliikangiella coralliicola]TQV86348.1 diguanylate cyclase [Aliikangiella coralliicola]
MILVLLNDQEGRQFLFDELSRQSFPVLMFESVAELQHWLELNPEPSGLIVDFTTSVFQDFLIRFSLRYPEVPVLSLKRQSDEQLQLRLLAFTNRLTSPQSASERGRILLVDDSRTVQMQYRKILEASGYLVDVADDAEQGFIKANQNKYDLAIIDFFMPGDNGAQLCQKLQSREETYELVCAILTAQYKQQVVDECLKSGARECMFKNESSDLFLTRVSALIRSVERKRQVESERTRLIGLLYSVAEGVYGVTPDGRIQFVNPATLKLLGQSMVDLMGHFPHECIHPIDNGGQKTSFDHCFLQQAYLLGDELRDWRTLFQRADGSLFPVECSVTLLGSEDNNEGSVVVFRDISEQQRLEKNWQWQLNHDHLTGLLNRSAFEEVLNRELNRIRRTKENSLLLFIDLDKFKLINDELGHAAGDQLLINLAENLKTRARDTDHVGRLAGDEFVVLLTHVAPKEFTEMAERYRMILEESNLFWEGKSYSVTGSVGATILDAFADSIGETLAKADQACQQAKQKGRNQWAIYNSLTEEQTEQGNWFKRLTSAMREQKFVLLQQQVFSADDSPRSVGANCSLRLKEGTALISPAIFMSNAKRFGVIKNIDRLVITMLIDFCQAKKSTAEQWFSVTLSTEAMSDENFRDELLSSWIESGLAPKRLRFEVGEEELFNFPQWQKHLAKIREKGFGVIISHFGMSSQSLLNLPQMPVDAIKLDSSLTRKLATSMPRCNLIDAIVKTASQSKVEVIATHIESVEDLDLIQARGVDCVQGFYLSKPEVL